MYSNYWNTVNDDWDDYYSSYDDIGFNSHTKKKKKSSKKHQVPSYTYNHFNFNWQNYVIKDNDDHLLTKSPTGYDTPTQSDIRFKNGSFEYISTENYDLIKNMSRLFYNQMWGEQDYMKEIDLSNSEEKDIELYYKLKQFLDELYLKDVPGYTPLSKAMFIYNELFKKNSGAESILEEVDLMNALGKIKLESELRDNPDIKAMMNGNEFTKRFEDEIMRKMFMIDDLGKQFEIKKQIEEKVVNNSELIVNRQLLEYSQLVDTVPYQFALPNFIPKLAIKDLQVNCYVERNETKQKVIILADASGSMNNTQKQQWLCAVLMERMRFVSKEECEIYFSYYETSIYHFYHLKNAEDVLYFWRNVYTSSPDGGGTRVGEIVDRLEKEVNSGKFYNLDTDLSQENPEVLILSDGQDKIRTSKFPYKCNSITVCDSYSDQLKQLCIESEGKYIHIDTQENITHYLK